MEAENIVDKKELKGLPIWACILLFIVVFFVFMLLYSALIQGFLSLVLGVEARHPGIVGYILQETGMFLAALTSAVIMLRFERRPFSDLGLSVKGHARGLWYGLLIAVLFYLVGFGLSLLLGEIEVTGFKFESVNLLGSWVFFLLVALFGDCGLVRFVVVVRAFCFVLFGLCFFFFGALRLLASGGSDTVGF